MGRSAVALRALVLATAVGGTSLLAVSAGHAAEEQLHNPSLTAQGHLLRGAGRLPASEGRDVERSSLARAQDIASPAPKGNGGTEPDLEEPGLPGYDGASSEAAASAAR